MAKSTKLTLKEKIDNRLTHLQQSFDNVYVRDEEIVAKIVNQLKDFYKAQGAVEALNWVFQEMEE